MHIVHIYPANDPETAHYVSLLSALPNEQIETTNDAKALQKICAERCPDIIHQHGCLNTEIIKCTLAARQQGARIVLTPHGQLEPWETDRRMMLKPSGLRQLVAHAYSIIARSPMEADELHHLKWNTRIETVRNPVITRSVSKEDFLAAHQRIYRQVMDSNVLELMDETTLKSMRTLLKVGITGDERWGEPLEPTAICWHLLTIYAQQEGILPFIEKGCLALGIQMPEKQAVPNYLPDSYVAPAPLTGKPLSDMIKHIHRQVQDKTLSLLSLAELDAALRCNDVEDDHLMQQLEADRLSQFFSALMTIMNEQTGLDEGFMPCTPVNNQETNRIRTIIKEHLQI